MTVQPAQPDRLDEYVLAQARRQIAMSGWAVYADDGRAYTIGLTALDRPELVVRGDIDSPTLVLNTLARMSLQEPLKVGDVYVLQLAGLAPLQVPGVPRLGYRPELMPADQGQLAARLAARLYGAEMRALFVRRLVEDPDAGPARLVGPDGQPLN